VEDATAVLVLDDKTSAGMSLQLCVSHQAGAAFINQRVAPPHLVLR
jgi:hypothetical protein